MKIQTAYKIIFREYPDLVTAEQLHKMLGNGKVSIKATYKLLRNNAIKSFIIGGRYMIPKVNVIKYLGIVDDG